MDAFGARTDPQQLGLFPAPAPVPTPASVARHPHVWRTAPPPPPTRSLFAPYRALTADLPPILRAYAAGLAFRPRVYSPERGMRVRGRWNACDWPNLQHGLPPPPSGTSAGSEQWIVLDLDYPLDFIDFIRTDRPTPHIVAQNSDNGHAHLFFRLAYPVRLDRCTRAGQWRESLAARLTAAWEADPYFGGRVAKNPLAGTWQVFLREAPGWTFRRLADHLQDYKVEHAQLELLPDVSDAAGRNCAIFDQVRMQAYAAARQGIGPETLREACERWGRAANYYRMPLPEAEIQSIAKSVARYCYGGRAVVAFRRRQADLGRRSGVARRAKSQALAEQALAIRAQQGYGYKRIAAELQVSTGAVRRWLGCLPRG